MARSRCQADANPVLPVAHLVLDLRATECVPAGPVSGVGLGLASGGGWAAEGVGVLGVSAELAVAGDDSGSSFPLSPVVL